MGIQEDFPALVTFELKPKGRRGTNLVKTRQVGRRQKEHLDNLEAREGGIWVDGGAIV